MPPSLITLLFLHSLTPIMPCFTVYIYFSITSLCVPHRLFVRKCSACLQVIGRSELIMRVLGQVYHLGCFSCCECERRLQRGDEFVLKEGQLLCRMDYEKEREMLAAISPTPTESGKRVLSGFNSKATWSGEFLHDTSMQNINLPMSDTFFYRKPMSSHLKAKLRF